MEQNTEELPSHPESAKEDNLPPPGSETWVEGQPESDKDYPQ